MFISRYLLFLPVSEDDSSVPELLGVERVVEAGFDLVDGVLWRVLVVRVLGLVTAPLPVLEGLSSFTAGEEVPLLVDSFLMEDPPLVVTELLPTDSICGLVLRIEDVPIPELISTLLFLPGRLIRSISDPTEIKGAASPVELPNTR
jgi:hypothetical protein